MLLCEACGAVFETALKRTAFNDFYPPEGYPYNICPYCHSEEVEIAEKCERCGEMKCFIEIDEGFCEKCREETEKKIVRILNKELSESEKQFALYHYDFEFIVED